MVAVLQQAASHSQQFRAGNVEYWIQLELQGEFSLDYLLPKLEFSLDTDSHPNLVTIIVCSVYRTPFGLRICRHLIKVGKYCSPYFLEGSSQMLKADVTCPRSNTASQWLSGVENSDLDSESPALRKSPLVGKVSWGLNAINGLVFGVLFHLKSVF